MLRATVRPLAGLATMAGVAMMCVGFLAPFGFAQIAPTCEISGDFVIELFDGTALRSDLDEFGATNGPFTTDLPAGRYSIRLQSFDRHSTESTASENAEAWFVRGLGQDGEVIWESAAIADLPEDIDSFSQLVDAGTDVPELAQVVAVHAAFPTESGANTVQAICAAFTIETPSTTTTRPPASAPVASSAPGAMAQGGGGSNTADGEGETGVLGVQIGDGQLPFTGPNDDATAIVGLGLSAVGAGLLLTVRDERPQVSGTRFWR